MTRSINFPETRRQWLLLSLLLVVVSLAWMAASRPETDAAPGTRLLEPAPRPGRLAPDFSLATLEGETLQLSAQRGRPVVLNFWASWCGPCRRETPHFQAMAEAYADQVIIIGVNQMETAEQAAAFAATYGLTYPLPLDFDGQVSRAYQIVGLPSTFFIAADGTIQTVVPGTLSQATLETNIQQLLTMDNG